MKHQSHEEITPHVIRENDFVYLINTSRKGIPYNTFDQIATKTPFSLDDWSSFLHLSERTIQRYKKEKRSFDPIHSEKILEISLLYDAGIKVFGSQKNFDLWLETQNIALGGASPKELLDSTFGIGMLRDELFRIEHGILA